MNTKPETMLEVIERMSDIGTYINWLIYQVIAQELLEKIKLLNELLSKGILENSEDAGDYDTIQHTLTEYREYLYRFINSGNKV